MIKKPETSEINRIAETHYNNLKEGLLYVLGKKILRIFYTELLDDKDSILLAYYSDKKTVGIAASTKDTEKLFNKIKKKYFLTVTLNILKKSVVSPGFISKLFESKYSSSIKAELLFLFVDKNHRGEGIGKKLVDATSKQFRKIGVKKYRITIMPSNKDGIKFYEKLGFKKAGEFKFFGKKRYIFTINT